MEALHENQADVSGQLHSSEQEAQLLKATTEEAAAAIVAANQAATEATRVWRQK